VKDPRPFLRTFAPSWHSSSLAVSTSILLILAFPDFNLEAIAWFALVPLLVSIAFEKGSRRKGFTLGLLSGTCFFFGTCWWLTFAPITYAGMSVLLSYGLLLVASLVAGSFFGIFASILSSVMARYSERALFLAPIVWPACEFLRYWITGNNWNAFGYTQAFVPGIVRFASFGGVYILSLLLVLWNATIAFAVVRVVRNGRNAAKEVAACVVTLILVTAVLFGFPKVMPETVKGESLLVTVVQPNVPMSGIDALTYESLRAEHVELAEASVKAFEARREPSSKEGESLIVFPESPMLFEYGSDDGLRGMFTDFTVRNNASLLFNSFEKTTKGGYFNSAVLLGPDGKKLGQYNKIFLLPFGEYVPLPDPLSSLLSGFVGSFEHGTDFAPLVMGNHRVGVMICFESHFPVLTSEYARRGADMLVEMTNDGYLGKTPILRQHLANSVLRAVETGLPVVRSTNVGITALITPQGDVVEPAAPYTSASRTWEVTPSSGGPTVYVRFGDWLAWLCLGVSLAVLFLSFRRRRD